MCTSLITLAIATFIGASVRTPIPVSGNWLNDYTAAQAKGRLEGKPLAVFVATGPTGYDKLTHEGSLGEAIRSTLARHYVCVYLDGNSTSAQGIIRALQIRSQGIVISDLTGGYQVYHHSGTLSQSELASRLDEFAQWSAPVYTTVSTDSERARSQVFVPAGLTRNC